MDDMVETMRAAPGVGLAAPQVGVDLRVIVVETPVDEDGDSPRLDGPTRLHVLANPEIVWADPAMEEGQEACLSVPDLFGDVERHVACKIRGLNAAGKTLELDVEGFEARVFQHEIDHLDGRLFTDRVNSLDKLYGLEDTSNGAADADSAAAPMPAAAAI
jgi:peptide deformylase